MRVHSVRLGFATNSSSTHSVILLSEGERAADESNGQDFGGDNFVLASRQAKLGYLAQQLRYALHQMVNDETALTLAEAWTGVGVLRDGCIDHQSTWDLPLSWDGRGFDREFFEELKAAVLQERACTIGGNDNCDEGGGHPLSKYPVLPGVDGIPTDGPGGQVARKDPAGYWVIFSRKTGTKVRLSFGEEEVDASKAYAPELVDLKITDYCPYGCPWCYQDSTPQGGHADRRYLEAVARVLGKMRVFEAAIGGGEPTHHPRFLELLRALRRNGVVPSFSTRNTAWLHDGRLAREIAELAGGIAFTVRGPSEIPDLAALLRTALGHEHVQDHRISLHYVVGSPNSHFSTERVLTEADRCNLRVTLLGFKPVGRAHGCKSVKVDLVGEIRAAQKKAPGLQVGIDTALAALYGDELKAAGVPDWCYEKREGVFSMYVDAVAQTMAPSSYSKDGTVPLRAEWMQEQILEAFGGWNRR